MKRLVQTGRLALALLAAASAGSVGCGDDKITEVVLVVTSDLRPLVDFDFMTISAAVGNGFPAQFSQCTSQAGVAAFPMTVGFTSGGDTKMFSATVQLTKNSFMFPQQIVTSRTVLGIPFAHDELRMFELQMKAACACQGTSCPNPDSNPDCANIENPETVPFDPLQTPPSNPYTGRCPGQFGGLFVK